jgi:hypothetical protein
MGSPDPSAGRLALAPTDPGLRPPDDRTDPSAGRRPEPVGAPNRRAGAGRRRLVVVTILLTIAAAAYFAVTSFGGGSGGSSSTPAEDAYLRANRLVATEGLLIIKAGTNLRALREIDGFRSDVDQSIAKIAAQITALQQLGARRSGTARSMIDETVAGAQKIAVLATAFEREVVKEELGPANRDEQLLRDEIVTLARLSTDWKQATKK